MVSTTVLYKDENFLWSGFYCNRSRHGNVTTPFGFLFIFVFLCTRSFFKKSLKGVCTCHNCLNYCKVWTNFMRAFSKYLKQSFVLETQLHLMVVWFHWKLCTKKEGNCSGRSRVRRILLTCIQLLLLQFLHVIWSTPTNFAFCKKPLDKFFYKLENYEINRQ